MINTPYDIDDWIDPGDFFRGRRGGSSSANNAGTSPSPAPARPQQPVAVSFADLVEQARLKYKLPIHKRPEAGFPYVVGLTVYRKRQDLRTGHYFFDATQITRPSPSGSQVSVSPAIFQNPWPLTPLNLTKCINWLSRMQWSNGDADIVLGMGAISGHPEQTISVTPASIRDYLARYCPRP